SNPVNAEACELAKLALAVWMLKPKQFDAFHHWMFDAPAPRSHEAARAKALEIIGDVKLLDDTLASHRLNMRIVRNVQLYDTAERGSLPKLLLGQRLLLGPANDEQSLFKHLEANTRLKPPAP